MSKLYIFDQNHKDEWTATRGEINNILMNMDQRCRYDPKYLDSHLNNFEVEIRESKIPKSLPQLKGIHKLCALLSPYLRERDGLNYTLEDVKQEVKYQFGYMRPPTPVEVDFMLKVGRINLEKLSASGRREVIEFAQSQKRPKSFADASKEEMERLITQIEAWAAEQGFEGVFLKNEY